MSGEEEGGGWRCYGLERVGGLSCPSLAGTEGVYRLDEIIVVIFMKIVADSGS